MGNIASETIINWGFNQDSNGFQVDVQDQTTPPIDFFFGRALGETTLAALTTIGAHTITVADATGFVAGTYMIILPSAPLVPLRFYIGTQLGAASGNVITLDSPLDYAYQVGDQIIYGANNMNVDGSVTPVMFEVFGPRAGAYDITRLMIKILTGTGVSLDKFGDISGGLTNGMVLRTIIGGEYRNIYNIKTNADWALMTYDYMPFAATNPVQGQDGVFLRNSFAGQNKHGVTIRLRGEDEKLQFIIQDDLTGLLALKVLVQGHYVVD